MTATEPSPALLTAVDHLVNGELAKFIGKQQRQAIARILKGEEAEGMAVIVNTLADTIKNMAVTYQQDGKGDDAIVYLHYFGGSYDGFVTEKDMDGGVQQAFGYGGFGDYELGYMCITEIIGVQSINIDLHFTPKTLREVKAELGAKSS